MVTQRCPRCASGRVRRGYRPTPIWSKVLFRYNLLCDNCNWEFTGFAVPGTVSTKPTKKPKKTPAETARMQNVESVKVDDSDASDADDENGGPFDSDGNIGEKAKKKRVKIKL